MSTKEYPARDDDGDLVNVESGTAKGYKTNSTASPTPSITAEKGADAERLNDHAPLRAQPGDESAAVDWDGDDDPLNPLNFSRPVMLRNICLVICMCIITPLASSMFAPGVPDVLQTFNTDQSSSLTEMVVSIYILGFAVGPLVISPLSEVYGRYMVYIGCNIGFVVFTIACAVAGSMEQLTVFRFFAGAFGVCPVTLGGATIADLVRQEKRGAAMSLFGLGPLLGPVIGPIAGAYVAADIGWRWIFWIITIAYAIITVLHVFLGHETYAPVLLERKTIKLRKESNDPTLRSKLDDGLQFKERMLRAIIRPLKMLCLSPTVFLMALYVAVVYGILYGLFVTFTFVFTQQYGFPESNAGLVYIGAGVGMLLGLVAIGTLSDRILKRQTIKHGTGMKPEYRLILLAFTSWLAPAGMFIYGWTIEYNVHWFVPIFGTGVFGLGTILAMVGIQQYLIDTYLRYAASAIAANTVLRSIVGGLLPLSGLTLYNDLGYGWGNSVFGFIALAMVPVPIVFYYYGEKLRKMEKVKF